MILPAIVVIVLDVLSKYLITQQTIKAEFVVNHGLAFSLPAQTIWSLIITAAITAVLFFYYFHNQQSLNKIQRLSFGLMIGGGLANLFDRLQRGWIIDFIPILSAQLNLADLAIMTGIILLIISIITPRHANQN